MLFNLPHNLSQLKCKKYNEIVDNSISLLEKKYESNSEVKTTEMLTCSKLINENLSNILMSDRIDEFSNRYRRLLDKFYKNKEEEYRERLRKLNNYYYPNLDYNKYLAYTKESRYSNGYLVLCGYSYIGDSRDYYYKIAKDMVDLYDIYITLRMENYKLETNREYFPAMENINEQCLEIKRHLEDNIYCLNEEHKKNNGDYLKQEKLKKDIKELEKIVDKLKWSSFNSDMFSFLP